MSLWFHVAEVSRPYRHFGRRCFDFAIRRGPVFLLRRKLRAAPRAQRPLSGQITGLGVTTYNRLEFLRTCIASLQETDWGGALHRVIVDDGSTEAGYAEFLGECGKTGITILRNGANCGVAVTKNRALRHMLDAKCEHLFLLEDDIVFKSNAVLREYIDLAEASGVQHLNFALHGLLNRRGERIVRHNGVPVLAYPNVTGAFSYFSRELLETIGLMDEAFLNALEHVDFTYRAAVAGYTLPFWQFADHPLNSFLLAEQPNALDLSVIRSGDGRARFHQACALWERKHGWSLLDQAVTEPPKLSQLFLELRRLSSAARDAGSSGSTMRVTSKRCVMEKRCD